MIISLAWNIMFTNNEKALVLNFLEVKNMAFLSQRVDGNVIFTDYWKVLVLIFSGMGNTVFFSAKKLMERWYLLITEKFLSWTCRWWEVRSFFPAKKLIERLYLLGLLKLSMISQDLGNMVFRAVNVKTNGLVMNETSWNRS